MKHINKVTCRKWAKSTWSIFQYYDSDNKIIVTQQKWQEWTPRMVYNTHIKNNTSLLNWLLENKLNLFLK